MVLNGFPNATFLRSFCSFVLRVTLVLTRVSAAIKLHFYAAQQKTLESMPKHQIWFSKSLSKFGILLCQNCFSILSDFLYDRFFPVFIAGGIPRIQFSDDLRFGSFAQLCFAFALHLRKQVIKHRLSWTFFFIPSESSFIRRLQYFQTSFMQSRCLAKVVHALSRFL